jgi:hypothetical protein
MLGISQAPAQAESQTEGVEMTDVTTDANASTVSPELAEQFAALQATVASMTEQLAINAVAMADKDSKIAELSAQVEAAVEFKASQAKIAAEAKVAARAAKLAEFVGDEQAASLQAATASLDDAAFDAVASAMSLKFKVEAKSDAFKEVGAEGATDQTKLNAEVIGGKTADYLQAIVRNELK